MSVTDVSTSSLTPLHWVGIAMALVTAAVHLVLGVGFLPHWMGVAFLVATGGFLVGIWLVVVDRRRRVTYLLGIPFTAGQVVFWYVLNDSPGLDAIGAVEAVDKVAQAVLIVVLVALLVRDA